MTTNLRRALASLPLLLAPAAEAGELLVSSRNTDQVLRYDADTGAFRGVFAEGGGLDNPVGLTFGPDGALYVVSANTSEVLRYDGRTGAFLGAFASSGLLPAGRQLNFGSDGDLYVSTGSTNRVLRFDGATGAFVGVAASGSGLNGPTSFTFGPGGDLFVGSVLTNRILRFDGTSGAFEGVFADQQLNLPHDVSFGPDGLLYVSNAGGAHDVVRFDPATGEFVDVFVSDPQAFFGLGLAWTPDGGLLLANQGGHEVRRYDARTGAFERVLVSSGSGGLDGPLFLARAPRLPSTRLRAFDPGRAGEPNWLALEGAQPGAEVLVLWGAGPGRQPLAACPGVFLGLARPRVLARARADEGGFALFDLWVRPTLAGQRLFLQAADLTRCEASPLLEQPLR